MMNNGTPLKALGEELNQYSTDHSALDYYQQQIPSAVDLRLDEAVNSFKTASPASRKAFQSSLTPASRSLFGIFGHRAATRAVREDRPDLLQLGLIASVIANYVIPDNRRVEIGLAIYYHSAARLELSPPDLFAVAAGYAEQEFAAQLLAFSNRGDVTLRKYGWKEVDSPDGILYKFAWK